MNPKLLAVSSALLLASFSWPLFGRAAQLPYAKHTHTYKTVGQCKIHLTTYRMPGEEVRPAILWIHGGALIAGHRSNISEDQLRSYLDAGFVLVSIDYRLAPETKLKAIIQDLRDAAQWLRSNGPRLLKIDPDRLAVVGGSAGGEFFCHGRTEQQFGGGPRLSPSVCASELSARNHPAHYG